MSDIMPKNMELIRKTLLSWYDQHARSLPWRQEQEPYKIWLSEIMLQQTRVDTVLPYYHRFLQAYPSLEALSSAGEEEVLKLWEGLGYYARARNFLSAVQEVQAKYGGEVPSDPNEFGRLPGVGEYTLAAVLSIAHGIPLAAVDGNVKRVISRLFCLLEDMEKPPLIKVIKQRANELLDTKRPGDFNQALMDLGASLCTPGNPSCEACPLESFCLAYRREKVWAIPPKKKRKPLPIEEITAVLILCGETCLIRQRPRKGLLGGLWELPTLAPSGTLTAQQVSLGPEVAVLHHQFSHLRWKVSVYRGELKGELPGEGSWRWVTEAELSALPFPRVYHPMLAYVREQLKDQAI